MTLYISGKITGDKHYKRKFAKAKARLLKKGFDVISPADIRGYKFLTYEESFISTTRLLMCATGFLCSRTGWTATARGLSATTPNAGARRFSMSKQQQHELFISYRSFHEALKELTREQYGTVMFAINEYALNHVEIPLEGIERMCFMLIKPQLDAALN